MSRARGRKLWWFNTWAEEYLAKHDAFFKMNRETWMRWYIDGNLDPKLQREFHRWFRDEMRKRYPRVSTSGDLILNENGKSPVA